MRIKLDSFPQIQCQLSYTPMNMYSIYKKMGNNLCVKKKHRDEKCNAATVTHYFANKSGTVFSSEKNMGFSVVANIEASGGNLDVTVEGP